MTKSKNKEKKQGKDRDNFLRKIRRLHQERIDEDVADFYFTLLMSQGQRHDVRIMIGDTPVLVVYVDSTVTAQAYCCAQAHALHVRLFNTKPKIKLC